ncbi:oxidoreductase [Sugiyamaella lignohabitans]|uniref:Oxidoreductase n=1 Tax=Sugiyamaella lignohabitans TaxID=796027 RepID=A0A167FQU2_9ASCO|nr:oxidoreductase [Sugiyamaella lignohabitans]ANB15581.1 oxidoreductase [Sugiyamaella lignohabitans]
MSFEASKLFDLTGRIALVTGGGTGLGAIITQAYIQNGASKVFISGRRQEKLEETAGKINQLGYTGKVIPIVGDVSTKEGAQDLVKKLTAATDSLDILVNNAGIMLPVDPARTDSSKEIESPEDYAARVAGGDFDGWVDQFKINAIGPYFVTFGLLPLLAKAAKKGDGRGSVIVITSIAGLSYPPAMSAAYQSSKAAAISVTKGLATRLSPYQIRVNSIAPGVFPSDMSVNLLVDNVKNSIPVRKFGDPEEIAGLALFLSSKTGGYTHGTNYVIDGGRLLNVPAS